MLRATASAILLSVVSPAGTPVNLDTFLDGQESCTASAAFAAFSDSLSERYSRQAGQAPPPRAGAKVTIPSEIRPAVGRAAWMDRGEYTEVRVPLVRTFRGLDVAEVEFAFGNGTGITAHQIAFSTPLTEVERRIGAAVGEGKKRMKEQSPEFDFTVELYERDGRARLGCDRST